MFDDLLEANRRYQTDFHDADVTGVASRGLAVLTCIDTRIDPLAMLGLVAGDAKIVRNAGARATDDALRSLVLATAFLGVTRVCVVQHTDCAMARSSEADLHERIGALRNADTAGWDFLAMDDQQASLVADLDLLRSCELLPRDLVVGGFVYDVHTGALTPVAS